MLVVISDLHLTDGTRGPVSSAGVFQLLAERIADLAVGASVRADGSYRPIEQVDLVLLGDVLDVIRSSHWLDTGTRPWSDWQSTEFSNVVSSITGEIIQQNGAGLGILRSLSQGSIRLTPATQMGRQAVTNESIPVPVRVHYVVGNRDWVFHLSGEPFNRLRRQLAVHLGLATDPDSPFPHEPSESDELLQTLRRHKVFARHGDIFDPLNFDGVRDASSLGDAIVVELLCRFTQEVERELAHELPDATIACLWEIDNIRPLLLAPVWIEGHLERTVTSASVRRYVKQIWENLADELLSHPFLRERDKWRPPDLIDGLHRSLKFSRRLPVGWSRSVTQWLHGLRGANNGSYIMHAMSEPDFRNRRAKHIVYGHTHTSEEVPLDSSSAEAYVLNQVYFNSGTWRRNYQQTQLRLREHEFVAHDSLRFLTFYQDDERKGRPYETWTGTLGVSPNEPVGLRVDPGLTSGAPTAATSNERVAAPHFSVIPGTTTVTTADTA